MKLIIKIPPFRVRLNRIFLREYLKDVGEATRKKMVTEAAARKNGRVYILKGGGEYQASAPGEFPANKFGHLGRSYRSTLGAMEVSIGTDVLVYPAYLRSGTSIMAKRRFLKEALEWAMEREHIKRSFVEVVK